jgi:hypothetical protein
MEHKTKYDSTSGVEVEICRACELLNKNFRAQVAYLRGYDNLFGYHDGSDYADVRRYLTSARDSLFEALSRHQRVHCGELDDSET